MSKPTPLLIKAVANWLSTLDCFRPVSVYSKNSTPKITDPDRPESPLKRANGFSVSHKLSFLYWALEGTTRGNNKELFFVTINYDMARSIELYASFGKSPIAKLSHQINAHCKRKLDEQPEFIGVVESSRDGSVHTHLIVAIRPEEKDQFVDICKYVSKRDNNSVVCKQTYPREGGGVCLFDYDLLGAKAYWESLKGVDSYGLHNRIYFPKNSTKYIRKGIHQERLLDVALMDYLAKELDTEIIGGKSINSRNYYAARSLAQKASKLQKEAYQLARSNNVFKEI